VGYHVLLTSLCFPVSIARYLAWGFQAAGCDVTVVGPASGAFIPWHGGFYLPQEYVWTPDLRVPFTERSATEPMTITQACEQLGRSDFDLVVQTDSDFALAGDAPSGCKVVCYGVDNHVRTYDQRPWDIFFGAHSWAFRSNEPNFRWLPCAYDPKWHFDKGGERPIDVAIVGVLTGDCYKMRMEGVGALVSNGLSVTAAVGKAYREYSDTYNVAKMAFCASANHDLACRVFEGMAMGNLILTDRVIDLQRIGFVEGEHYLGYSSLEELVEQARRGMDTELRGRIVTAAKEAVAGHTWQNRAEAILGECGL
jgi:hypothetical protein